MGLDYEIEMMPFPPRFLKPEYLEINMLGTIPYMIDGKTKMTESVGISQYLVDKYGPTDLKVSVDEEDYGSYLNWLTHADATLTFPQTVFHKNIPFKNLESQMQLLRVTKDGLYPDLNF